MVFIGWVGVPFIYPDLSSMSHFTICNSSWLQSSLSPVSLHRDTVGQALVVFVDLYLKYASQNLHLIGKGLWNTGTGIHPMRCVSHLMSLESKCQHPSLRSSEVKGEQSDYILIHTWNTCQTTVDGEQLHWHSYMEHIPDNHSWPQRSKGREKTEPWNEAFSTWRNGGLAWPKIYKIPKQIGGGGT